jgi:hypothetical protein
MRNLGSGGPFHITNSNSRHFWCLCKRWFSRPFFSPASGSGSHAIRTRWGGWQVGVGNDRVRHGRRRGLKIHRKDFLDKEKLSLIKPDVVHCAKNKFFFESFFALH